MKIAALLIGVALCAGATSVQAQTGEHVVLTPQAIKWGPAPASLPPGAQVAVLYGDPSKAGAFAMRIKAPKGFRIPPHSHPEPEIVTIVSGTFRLGMGEVADRSKTQALPAGSFFVFQPGMHHYAWTDEETVIQINSTGPWGIDYVNPADDPRKKGK